VRVRGPGYWHLFFTYGKLQMQMQMQMQMQTQTPNAKDPQLTMQSQARR
jgi:hypothetical protein